VNRKSEILAELARSRAAIRRDTNAVRAQIDVTARVKRSVLTHPFAWLGGAAALGYILAGPKTRTKTVVKTVKEKSGRPAKADPRPRGFWGICLLLVRLVVPLVRPALSAYAARRLGSFADRLGSK
jgi:hypothetical protein